MASWKKRFQAVPKYIWILLIIICVGVFLRTYRLHSWLDFGSDQVNDAQRVGAVVEGKAPWPAYGPDMSSSGAGGRESRFRLGPLYYDLEIVSAKIFGNNPVSMALPDWLFGVLAIPLFFYFLRRVFSINISLALTALYAISFFSLSFSHSAWNVNSIPFFSLLFLLSLYELIMAKEKTHWGWAVLLGIALGVSVQLHAILLVLFPAMLFFISLFCLRKNWRVGKQLILVILVALILNLGQIKSEQENGYINTKIFFTSASASGESNESLSLRVFDDLSCNFQANTYMLSSAGTANCDFTLSKALGAEASRKLIKEAKKPIFIFSVFLVTFFSLLGYGLLITIYRQEKDVKRKYFSGLILLYATLSFFVMLPVIDVPLRYFVHVFFVPFIFLGLLIEFVARKFSLKLSALIIASIFVALVWTNINSIKTVVKNSFADERVILGRVEAMVDFMLSQSDSQKEIYLFYSASAGKFFTPLRYVANQKGYALKKAEEEKGRLIEKNVFYLKISSEVDPKKETKFGKFDEYQIFNQAILFHLQK